MKKPGAEFAFRPKDSISSPERPDFSKTPNKKARHLDLNIRLDGGILTNIPAMVKQRAPTKAPLQPTSPNDNSQPQPSSKSGSKVRQSNETTEEDPLLARFNALRVSTGGSPQSQPLPATTLPRAQRSESPDDVIEMFRARAIKDNLIESPDHSSQGSSQGHGGSQGYGDPFRSQRPGFSRPTQVMSSLKQKAANVFLPQKTRPEHHRDPPRKILAPSAPTYQDTKAAPIQMFSSLASDVPQPAANYGEVEFYTDPDKAAEDLKALLEGGMDEDDDEDKGQPEEKDDGTVAGLKVKLLPHQVEGVEWMKGRELGPVKRGKVPKGGILADDMGLGKTLQTLALMLGHQKPAKDQDGWKKHFGEIEKSTLVVAPLSLIRQWEAEIKEKVSRTHALKVLVHHGPQRTKNHKDLLLYDVVVTTYQVLVSEWGNSNESRTGCFGAKWWRVVLDEAHTIKNRNAKCTKACYALRSEYRWCLTGTPMQNNLEELQSLICFLRISPYDNLKEWKMHIEKPINNGQGHIAIRRLHSLLRCFMKRRTKEILKEDGALNPGGKPSAPGEASTTGFKVTERKVVSVATKFSPAERRFYDRLEARTDRSIKEMLKGTVSYASALVLLLRLRQACNHPKLVAGKLDNDKDALTTDSSSQKATTETDVDALADMLGGITIQAKKCDICGLALDTVDMELRRDSCKDCLEDLEYFDSHESKERKRPKKKAKVKTAIEEVTIEAKGRSQRRNRNTVLDSDDEEPEAEVRKDRRRPNNRNRVVDSDDEEEEEGSWLVPEDQRGATRLGKAGGEEDENAEGGGEWLGDDDSQHPSENEEGSQLDSFVVNDEDVKAEKGLESGDGYESDETFASISKLHIQRREQKASSKAKDEDEDDSEDYTTESDDDLDDAEDDEEYNFDLSNPPPILASAKIRHLMKILDEEVHEHKFIVFSQFTSMLDLVEPFFTKKGIKFTRYDGKMRNDEREASLHRLRNDKKTRVLLCSLKCGSLGLNLTAATRVVILEPFWNPFVEEQAIDRVHRLTQTIDVVVYKLTIKDSVEERILALQDRKRLLAQEAIEGGMKKDGFKLGVKEILELFKHGDMARSNSYEDGDVGSMVQSMAALAKKAPRKENAVYGRRW